jgi:hypothetical protein
MPADDPGLAPLSRLAALGGAVGTFQGDAVWLKASPDQNHLPRRVVYYYCQW